MKPGKLAMAALLVSGLLAGQGFSQAAAEGALTHGLASGAGSTLGKTLGNALGNAAGQMGNRLGQQTATVSARQRVPAAKATSTAAPGVVTRATVAPSSSSGSLIASIQGGVSPTGSASLNCTPGVKAATTASAKSDASSNPSQERTAAASNRCAPLQDVSHPAVVNLRPAN